MTSIGRSGRGLAWVVVAGLLAAASLAGCAPTSAPQAAVSLPPSGSIVDYQLGGGYEPASAMGGVARDSTDVAAPGLYSICYLNGFQTQPADRESWLRDHADLVLTSGGEPVIDENWPDELILDTSTADRRQQIVDLAADSFALCDSKGFSAVEIDNLDSYTRSGGALTMDDALAMATLFARAAHERGLAIAQKNSAELGARGRDEVGFDFAVAEECQRFDECAAYTDVYATVLDIEYTDDLAGSFREVCADPQVPPSTILRDRDLTTPASTDYVFEHC